MLYGQKGLKNCRVNCAALGISTQSGTPYFLIDSTTKVCNNKNSL